MWTDKVSDCLITCCGSASSQVQPVWLLTGRDHDFLLSVQQLLETQRSQISVSFTISRVCFLWWYEGLHFTSPTVFLIIPHSKSKKDSDSTGCSLTFTLYSICALCGKRSSLSVWHMTGKLGVSHKRLLGLCVGADWSSLMSSVGPQGDIMPHDGIAARPAGGK